MHCRVWPVGCPMLGSIRPLTEVQVNLFIFFFNKESFFKRKISFPYQFISFAHVFYGEEITNLLPCN